MTPIFKAPGLQIESELVNPQSANFIPPTWPPRHDFPVVIDSGGIVVSRYGDSTWNLAPWAGVAMSISFGDGKTRGRKVSPPNAALMRQVAAWWLWGPNGVRKASTFAARHEVLKPVFIACTDAGILASDLYRFPRVIERVAGTVSASAGNLALSYLNYVWLAREDLGFTILDENGLKLFSRLIVQRDSTQTAYIPPRIWTYQVLRLKEALDDYLAHQEQVEACFRFCLDAYTRNAGGSIAKLYKTKIAYSRAPFNPYNMGYVRENCVFHGPFRLTARRFGIEELLDRWVHTSNSSGIKALSSYLSLKSLVGLAYLLNFSMMRVNEGNSLRANCYEVERDPLGDDIHLIGGVTTKTIEDQDARWIVTPSVKRAVDVMRSVATLRLEAAQHDPRANLSDEDIRNPMLQARAYEPWAPSQPATGQKKREIGYSYLLKNWSKLFDQTQIRITKEDLAIARQMTFGLDPTRFAIGEVWPFAWHQLRRTGAVNMLASGLVSDSSVQYQLKHATRAMSRYYGQNYYRLNAHLDDETRGLYLREMYQTLVREFQELQSERFVSPHGAKRKAQIINSISEKDHDDLLRDAEAGRVSYRENFLGGCTKLGGPCELGGISNVSGCMGFGPNKPCEHLLLNRDKRQAIIALRDIAVAKREAAQTGAPLHESLQAQIESMERALNVLDTA